jgi:hypothetical protein
MYLVRICLCQDQDAHNLYNHPLFPLSSLRIAHTSGNGQTQPEHNNLVHFCAPDSDSGLARHPRVRTCHSHAACLTLYAQLCVLLNINNGVDPTFTVEPYNKNYFLTYRRRVFISASWYFSYFQNN